MAIHLNIGSKSTIKYRTDCFGQGSRTDYHINAPSVIAADVETEQDNFLYDIGYYGSIRTRTLLYLSNPFICDNLLMLGSFQEPTIISDSVYYDELVFTRPMIAIDRSSVRTQTSESLTLRSDTFTVVDRIYTDITSRECLGNGTRYINGVSTEFSGIFNTPTITTQEPLNRMSLLLELPRKSGSISGRSYEQYIASAEELQNYVFPNGNQYPAFWSQILQCEYGAYIGLSTDDYILSHPLIIRCQIETQSGEIEVSDFPYYGYFKYHYVIPFISQDEFDAAYAANYPWGARTVQQIDKYYYNKFK